MRLFLLIMLGMSLLVVGTAHAADATDIGALLEDWHDADRDRTVPIKVDYPKSIDKPLPVVLISHGLGGLREGLAYIGQYWAGHGYVAIHLQHPGSDEGVWKGVAAEDRVKVLNDAATPLQFLARVKDVTFALDELKIKNADPKWPLHGKLDLDRIAMAGHSFGAVTTQAMCGQLFTGGKTFADFRIKAGIVFSPSPPSVGDAKSAFKDIAIPMFYWTGTKDVVPLIAHTAKAADRRVPFDVSRAENQYLVVLTEGDHMVFNGTQRDQPAARPNDPAWHHLIEQGTTAFLDKYLKSDAAQVKYLDEGGFLKDADGLGTFEKRLPPKPQ